MELIAIVSVCLISSCFASPLPFPQSLTETEFRSLRDEATPSHKVIISPSYASVRRQGRMHNGEPFEFKRPQSARFNAAPSVVSVSGRVLTAGANKKLNRFDAAPVFDLSEMMRKEAAKLRAKVQEASLKAALAAEEAEKKLEAMAKDMDVQEVEAMVEDAVQTGIKDAAEIIQHEMEKEEEEMDAGSGEEEEPEEEEKEAEMMKEKEKETEIKIMLEEAPIQDDVKAEIEVLEEAIAKEEEMAKIATDLVKEVDAKENAIDNDEPSREIDLGSVQEV